MFILGVITGFVLCYLLIRLSGEVSKDKPNLRLNNEIAREGVEQMSTSDIGLYIRQLFSEYECIRDAFLEKKVTQKEAKSGCELFALKYQDFVEASKENITIKQREAVEPLHRAFRKYDRRYRNGQPIDPPPPMGHYKYDFPIIDLTTGEQIGLDILGWSKHNFY